MTKRDRKALARYIRTAADHMELRDWTFDLLDDPAPHGALGWYSSPIGQRHAELRFCADFRSKDPQLQRDTVAHELIHCHLACLQQQAESDTAGLGKKAAAQYRAGFRRNLEFAVDALERVIAKELPLIAWPT